MAKSLNTANEHPTAVLSSINHKHDKLLFTESNQEEEIKNELNKKMNAREDSLNSKKARRSSKMQSEEIQTNRMTINQSQLISKNAIKLSHQQQHQQPAYLPIDKRNYLKINRIQQQYLNSLSSCACNDCALCNKQTRAINQLKRELQMARGELRELRHYLLLSNSSKHPLNCLAYDDDDDIALIPAPQRFASNSMPNTPAHRLDVCFDQQCQDCYFNAATTNLYQPNSIHNISSPPCGLEHLLPNVNCAGCCLEEGCSLDVSQAAQEAYDLHQASKKAFEQKKSFEQKAAFDLKTTSVSNNYLLKNASSIEDATIRNRKAQMNKEQSIDDSLIGAKSNIQLEKQSRLNKNKTSLAAMQTFTLDQDDLEDYVPNKLEINQGKQVGCGDEQNNNYYFNEPNSSSNVKTNVKTQSTTPFHNRPKTKSLNRSLSKEFNSLNYSKSESFDEINFHQKNREEDVQQPAKKQSLNNYETTC